MKPIKSEYQSLPSEYESRDIFTAQLTGLEPDTQYAFRIKGVSMSDQNIYFFKTFNPSNFTIVNGGDIGINEESKQMNNYGLKNTHPDLMMIGGDISYDNNFPECYRATDQILMDLPHAVPQHGTNYIQLIPMIKAAGNHDLGVNANNNIQLRENKYEPLFKHYYPQNSKNGNAPLLSQRKSYFYHLIGNTTLIISLDSGYGTPINGEQSEWLERILKRHQGIPFKFVHYHEPLYPACDFKVDKTQELGFKYWVPLFEKYNVTIVFENHNHSLKRTYNMMNGQKSETGPIYIGDGAWGALDHPCETLRTKYLAAYQAVNHVWVIDVTEGSLFIKAIGKDRKILDELVINI